MSAVRSLGSLRRLFDVAERAIGGPLEALIQTEYFANGFTALINVESSVRRRAERFSRRLLHGLNIPAGSDVRRLEMQLSRIERTLEQMRPAVRPPHPQGVVALEDEER